MNFVNYLLFFVISVFHLIDGTVDVQTNQSFIEKLFHRAITTTELPELDKFDTENVETNHSSDTTEKLFNQAITTTEPPELDEFDFDPENDVGDIFLFQSPTRIIKLYNKDNSSSSGPSKQKQNASRVDSGGKIDQDFSKTPGIIVKQYNQTKSTPSEPPEPSSHQSDHQNFEPCITDYDYDMTPTAFTSGASSTNVDNNGIRGLPLMPLLCISYIIYLLV